MGANVLRFTADSLRLAANVVSGGGLIVFPTDTVYGLGCDPMNGSAVQKLFEVKGRASKPIPLLCESLQKASELVELSPIARGLAKKFWPGALTVVAPLKLPVPFPLHQGSGTLGVRVPGGRLCLELIRECGGWLTGTSANLSGRHSSTTARQASDQLGGSVDLILDGGPTGATESTVVQVVGDKIVVLRQGQVGVTDELRGT
ncbi:MAG: threonylcarbamoyl-AMP synthase [Thaumarchaeota archaeon]|nr:threonylcarbamoyl-AMP synthase [Nitrososphaerota archaeon]